MFRYGRRGWNNKRQRKNYANQEEEDSTDSSGNDESLTAPTPRWLMSPTSTKPESSEPIDETQFKSKVHALLKKISGQAKGTNEFAISGPLTQAPNMLISIKDGGVMRFPMYDDETQKVIDAFERSPYGKGTETVVDPSVRNSWQLNPSGFNIMNPQWEVYLKEVLIPKIGREMGIVPTTFAVSLYKLLLYKTGSFFKVHRDSEKEERMFGTLVVQLPSKYTGGELVVNHDSKTKTIDFSSSADANNEFQMFYSAFYCDCEHEILPLTSGVRVCLIYNLTLTNTDVAIPLAPRMTEIEGQLSQLLNDWKAHKGPAKIVYSLSHRYTENNFSQDSLKSSDKNIAKTLLNLSKENDFAVLMGIFEKESAGCSKGDTESDFDSDDEDCYAEKTYTLKDLKCLETDGDNKFNLKSLSVEEEEVIPENCFKNKSPYDQTSEYTGNEGVNVSLFYRGAALVLFPAENIIEIFMKDDELHAAEQIFLKEFEKFRAISKDTKVETKLKKWANQMAIKGNPYSVRDSKNPVSMLSAIIYFNDLKLLQSFLDHRVPINEDTLPLIVGQCEKFGWTSLSPQLSKMLKASKNSHSALKLLNVVLACGQGEEKKAVCCQLAQVVLDLEKNKSSAVSYSYYRLPAKTPADIKKELEADQKFLFDFCQTAKKIDFNILEYLKTKSVSVVGPVLIKLSNPVDNTLDSYWMELVQYFLETIEKIAAKSVIIPNWRFTNFAPCGCEDCAAVNAFMISDRISEGFKLAKPRRLHIHQKLNSINNIRHETERVGSPFKLVLTKLSHCQAKASEAEEQKIAKELLPKFRAMISPQNA